MSSLYFASNLKLINLTPFKYSLCLLINAFLKDKEITKNIDNILLFGILIRLLNEFKCEISKNYFFNKIKQIIDELHQDESMKITKSNLTSNILFFLESNYQKVKSINDLYILFNYEMRELQLKNESNESIIEKGGIIDNFIRKVLLAFYKLSFEDLCKLYTDLTLYIKGDELAIQLSNRESEILFEKQMTDLAKIGRDSYDEKILESVNYRHKYFHLAKLNLRNENSIFDTHKFFDYNMKYFYNDTSQSDTKIHYSLMNLIEYYYENGFYQHAIQGIHLLTLVLIECIKLNQSNCDHEGLLKCFLWMQKIYRNLGNHEMAKKFLSTCLIKSFENNFTLLYLISTSELAILNYNYFSRVGDRSLKNSKQDNFSYQSIEEKILSFSNSYSYSYKNLIQFLSGSKTDFVYDNSPNYYLKFVYVGIILNLLRKGKNSLSISYLKKFFDFIIRGQKKKEMHKDSYILTLNYETIEICMNLLFEIYEYDIEYVVKRFEDILSSLSQSKDLKRLDYIIELLKEKFLSFTLANSNFSIISVYENEESESKNFHILEKNIYYSTYIRYLQLENSFFKYKYANNKITNTDRIEKDLVEFKSYCKNINSAKFKMLSNNLIAKIFVIKGKITEALFEITKSLKKLEKTNEEYLTFKLKLTLLEIYIKLKYSSKVESILIELEVLIDNIGSVIDKYEFYFIYTQSQFANTRNNSSLMSLSYEIRNSLFSCVKNAILSNNTGMIKNSILLLDFFLIIINPNFNNIKQTSKNFYKIKEITQSHLDQLNKLLSIFEIFPLLPKQSFELIRIIHSNNQKTIKIIESLINK